MCLWLCSSHSAASSGTPASKGMRGACSPWGRGWDEAACQHLWDGQHALSLEMAAEGLLGGGFALDLVIRVLCCTPRVKPVVRDGLKTELFTGVFMPRRVFAGNLPPENTSPVSLQGLFLICWRKKARSSHSSHT